MRELKDFLLVGAVTCIQYKDVFPYIKTGEIKFRPQKYAVTTYENSDKKICGTWYTTLTVPYVEPLELTKTYNEKDYPKYDNYDTINVNKTKDIPCDYYGTMGVPITFLSYYCPGQFELIGCLNNFKNSDYKNGLLCGEDTEIIYKDGNVKIWNGPIVNKKALFARLIIKRKIN